MKNTKKYLKMSDKEIKSEFIKYFGKDKWNEEEAIENLNDIEYILSEVLVLPTIPVITEDIPNANLICSIWLKQTFSNAYPLQEDKDWLVTFCDQYFSFNFVLSFKKVK